ncbi:polysaccharide deacetylase family protein [Tissierella carlieri]|uniref:Polysaccharide deacetylase family protein n=1 Tax=Tissierella carlieri TaxID=689904 RepID=A0ABT1SFY9_9FIRM|nr:polysaccharide deacetylase family protein [Tissierella carlieri]MCQ4925381.1 polysaccharide deacetylase family protein [Tissierella carlieri]
MRKILSFILILFITISLINYIKKDTAPIYSNNLIPKEEMDTPLQTSITRTKRKDLGEIETIIEYGDYSSLAAHYPIFGIESIDSTIKDMVQGYINNFYREIENNTSNRKLKSELNIDFDMYITQDDIVSLKFSIMESMSYNAHPNTSIKTFVINLGKEEFISLDDIFKGEYLSMLSEIIINHFSDDEEYKEYIETDLFKEKLASAKENLDKFVVQENSIILFFEKYELFAGSFGEQEVEISYRDLKGYLKKELEDLVEEPSDSIVEENRTEKPKEIVEGETRIIDSEKPMVCLTFDDGPNEKTTIPILDTLKKHNSVGTFFVLGNRVSHNKEILERMIAEGSEVGNHTYNHKKLTSLSTKDVKWQIKSTQDAIDAIAISPKVMRPTYGAYDDTLKSTLDMPMILWSIDTLDWKYRDTNRVVKSILDNVTDGDIILMHDLYESTANAVEKVVPELIDRGFQLVTVSELYEARGKTLESGKTYNHVHKNR